MAATSSASVAVLIPTAARWMIGKVCSPRCVVWAPSAIVAGTSMRTIRPAASERRPSSPASGSTPYTRHSGASASAASSVPANSPPPPSGTNSASSAPTSPNSSNAAVPWPASTSGWS